MLAELTDFLFPVGKSHIKRKISKKSYNDLRSVVVDVLSDVCKLDDEGKGLSIKFNYVYKTTFFRQSCVVKAARRFFPRSVRMSRRTFR